MELPLQTILSITTGFLHCSYTDLTNAVCGITGKSFSISLVMIGIPLAKEHIIKHFPQFEGF